MLASPYVCDRKEANPLACYDFGPRGRKAPHPFTGDRPEMACCSVVSSGQPTICLCLPSKHTADQVTTQRNGRDVTGEMAQPGAQLRRNVSVTGGISAWHTHVLLFLPDSIAL